MSVQLVRNYQRELSKAKDLGVRNEMGLKRPFSNLLYALCQTKNLTLVEEISIKNPEGKTIRPDGIVKGVNRLDWGYWEEKDEVDDIEEEIKKKFAAGYPNDNIIFEDTKPFYTKMENVWLRLLCKMKERICMPFCSNL